MLKSSLKNIFFVFLFFVPVGMMYLLYSDCFFVESDSFLFFGRNIFNSDSGRYVATVIWNFVVEHLPRILNVHIFDLYSSVIFPFEILISVLVFLLISFPFVFFFDKNDKAKGLFWLLAYLSTFFLLFNATHSYFGVLFPITFLEYEASLIPFLLFLCFIIYFYSSEKIPKRPIFILFLILSFSAGLTLEVLNIPSVMFTFLVTMLALYDFCSSEKNFVSKQRLKMFLSVFLVNLTAFLMYYIAPPSHGYLSKHISFSLNSEFLIRMFDAVVIKLLPFHFVNILAVFLILFFRKSFYKQNIRIISSVFICNLCFFIYYFFVLHLILFFVDIDASDFFCGVKTFLPYIAVLLSFNFLLLGYFIAHGSYKNNCAKNTAKIIAICSILLVNFQLFIDYIPNFVSQKNENKKDKEIFYAIEKSLMTQVGQETVIIPLKKIDNPYGLGKHLRILVGVFAVHYPDFEKLKTVITDSNLDTEELSEEEKKNLKFSNLLLHKINKLDKNFNMDFFVDKKEGSRVYYKRNLSE